MLSVSPALKLKGDGLMRTLLNETIVINDGPLQQQVKCRPLSRAVWLEMGERLLHSAMTSNWDIGDWALLTPAEASRNEVRELLDEAAARTGYAVNTIRDLRTVAERIPPALRNRGLSWYGYKEISKLAVREDCPDVKEKSIALRSEFIDDCAAQPKMGVLEIRSAVRAKMGKGKSESDETETVSFKLTAAEFASLSAIVDSDPIHETVSGFVQELVRNLIVIRTGARQ